MKKQNNLVLKQALAALLGAEKRLLDLEKQGRIQNGVTLRQIRGAIKTSTQALKKP